MSLQTGKNQGVPIFALAILAHILINPVLSGPAIDRRFARGSSVQNYKNLDLNQTIDKHLDLIYGGLTSMDPSDLKNVSLPLVSDIGIDLYNGTLRNLAQLRRAGPCTISFADKVIVVEGVFGWDSLSFDYTYLTKIWSINMSGKILGELKQLKVAVVLTIDPQNHQVILEQFKFVDAGDLKVKFDGNMIDFISNQAIGVITWMGKDLILGKVMQELESFIEIDVTELNKLLPEYKIAPYKFINKVPAKQSLVDA